MQWNDVNEVHDRFVRTTGVPIVVTEGTTTRPATVTRSGSDSAMPSPVFRTVRG